MTYLMIFILFYYLYNKSKTPYFMEYRTEFVSCPSRSKKMVWALRRRNGIFRAETIQIDNDKSVIENVLRRELSSSYSINPNSISNGNIFEKIKVKLISFHTGISI